MRKSLSMTLAVAVMAAAMVVPAYAAESVDYTEKLSELKTLMNQCSAKGIPTDYEQVSYATIERFEDYINQDLAKGIDIADYEKACIDAIFGEAKANLEGYIDGTKEAKEVLRPDMHSLSVKGNNLYFGKSPVNSIGYGFFGMAQADIPVFQDFGVNNIQMEIGPHQTWGQGSYGWSGYTGVEGLDASAEMVDTDAHQGEKSLNIVFNDIAGANRYIVRNQVISCKPNTTYTFGCWSKGTASGTWMAFDWGTRNYLSSSSDWQKNTFTYTTGADATSMELMVLVEDKANIYLDDFFVYEADDKNLVMNPGVEGEIYEAVEDLKNHLENAKRSNVGVSLLLAPHYLTDIAQDNGISLTTNANATFIRFDINDIKAKEIIEQHIRTVLSSVKDYDCIDSICISNEPWFDTRWFESTYNPLFREYVLEKHGNIEAIRKLYGLSSWQGISSVSMPKIEDGSFLGWYDVDAQAYDWMEFNDRIFCEWHKWMADIVKEYLPDTPVHSKVMENIVPTGETKERIEMARGTDYDMFGEFSDYSGIDGANYTQDDYYKMMFMYDYLESSVGKPVYNSETHIIKDYNGDATKLDAFSDDTTKKALTKMWQGAIHGRDMSTVWAWQRQYADDSSSDFYGSILFRPDLVAGLGQMNLDFSRLSDEIAELQANSQKVAILYSKPSRLYNNAHITKVLEVYKDLVSNGYDVGVVTEKSIEKLAGYKTLIIPDATHTTEGTLTKIESFIAGGGRVLFTDTGVLAYNEYEQSLSGANVINSGTAYSIQALPEKEVKLVDASTGAKAEGIEWQYSVTEDRILVNAVNMTDATKTVDVYFGGEKLTNLKELTENISGIGSVTLPEYEPKLLEYNLNATGSAGIKDVVFDEVRKTIRWKNVGSNISGVAVYKYNSDNTLSEVKTTRGDEFAYADNGTYLLCPVTDNGEMLEGKVITTEKNLATLKILDANTVQVKNNTSEYIRVKVLFEALDSFGNVIGTSSSKVLMKPDENREISVALSSNVTPDSIKVTVYDDAGSFITEVR